MNPQEAQPTIAEQVAAFGPTVIEHFNSAYPDVVNVVARAHVGRDDIGHAEMTGLTHESFTLRVTTADGDDELTVAYSTPVADLAEIRQRTLDIVAAARTTLGITELTSAELEAQAINALRTHVTSVVRTEALTPHFKQITFGGGDLTTFEPGGLDQFLYVLAPPPGRTELTIDASFSWEGYDQMPEAERPVGAYYTVRRWRPEVAELDMLFLLHDEGAATTWAARAKPGDPVALWGPRTAYEPPADTDWYLLAADESGLPAVGVILEHLSDDTPAHVFVELDSAADQLPLAESPSVHVHWLYRDGRAPGTTTLLADAVRSLDHPAGNVYAWGGAESRSMTAIRKHLRRELEIEQPRVSMVGYWRHSSNPYTPSEEPDD